LDTRASALESEAIFQDDADFIHRRECRVRS